MKISFKFFLFSLLLLALLGGVSGNRVWGQLRITAPISVSSYKGTNQLVQGCNHNFSFTLTNTGSVSINRTVKLWLLDPLGAFENVIWQNQYSNIAAGATIPVSISGTTVSMPNNYSIRLDAWADITGDVTNGANYQLGSGGDVTTTSGGTSAKNIQIFPNIDACGTMVTPTTYTVSGQITESGVGLAGVSIGTTTTDGSGNYSVTVNSGGSVTLTPSLAGYTFSPPSIPLTNVTSNQTGKNFTATASGGAGTVAMPTFSPIPSTYTTTQSVIISCATAGATIYYTTDGTVPTTSSTVYTSAISVSATTTIKAIAIKSPMTDSGVATGAYTISMLPANCGTPSGLNTTAGDNKVDLSWTAVGGATEYKVYRDGSNIASPTGTTYTDNSAMNGTSYCYTISATGACTESVRTGNSCAIPIAPPANVIGTITAPNTIVKGNTLNISASITNNGGTASTTESYILSWDTGTPMKIQSYSIAVGGNQTIAIPAFKAPTTIGNYTVKLTKGGITLDTKIVSVTDITTTASSSGGTPTWQPGCKTWTIGTDAEEWEYINTSVPNWVTIDQVTATSFRMCWTANDLTTDSRVADLIVLTNKLKQFSLPTFTQPGAPASIAIDNLSPTLTAGSTVRISWKQIGNFVPAIQYKDGSTWKNTNETGVGIRTLGNNLYEYYWIVPEGVNINNSQIRMSSSMLSVPSTTNTFNIQNPPKGVTVIVHGFSGGGDLPPWTLTMATAIKERCGGQAIVYKSNRTTGAWDWVEGSSGEIILIYDWAIGSNNFENGWAEAAGDNLFASIVKIMQERGINLNNNLTYTPFHFIAHSRGNIVSLEAFRRFEAYFPLFKVKQWTALDPHPADATIAASFKDFPRNGIEVNTQYNYQIILPANVEYCDVYRRRGWFYEPLNGGYAGVPIIGADNFELIDDKLINAYVTSNIGLSVANQHSNVHLWYYGTITTKFGANNGEHNVIDEWYPDAYPLNKQSTGFRHLAGYNVSRIGNGSVTLSTLPNNSFKLSPPTRNFINGDFLYGSINSDPLSLNNIYRVPGWQHHGGYIYRLDENGSDKFLTMKGEQAVRSNFLYVPPTATHLMFNFSTNGVKKEYNLSLTAYNKIINNNGQLVATPEKNFYSRQSFKKEVSKEPVYFEIPADKRGKVFSFEVKSDNEIPTMWPDNFKFVIAPEYNSQLVAKTSKSLLSGAQIKHKKRNIAYYRDMTDSRGTLKLKFDEPLLIGDTLEITAPNTKTITIRVDNKILNEGQLDVPMIAVENPTEAVEYMIAEPTQPNTVYTNSSVTLKVKAKNHIYGFDIYNYLDSANSYRKYTQADSLISVNLLPDANNLFKVRYLGRIDTVYKSVFLEHISTANLPQQTYNFSLRADNTASGAYLYIDDSFVGEVKSIQNFALTKGSHDVMLHKFGYSDLYFAVNDSTNLSYTAKMVIRNYALPTEFSQMDFSKDSLMYYNGMTVEKFRNPNGSIKTKRYKKDLSTLAVKAKTEAFELENTATTQTKYNLLAILDQKEDLQRDSIYALKIKDNATYQKVLTTSWADSIVYDKISQKFVYNNLSPKQTDVVLLAQRQAPIKKDTLSYTIYKGSTLRLPVTAVFADPDSIKKDMTMLLKVPNPNFEVVQVSPDTIELKRCLTGEHTLSFAAIHDGYEVVNNVKVTVIPLVTNKKNVSCKGEATGEASVVPQQGTEPIGYEWSNGEKVRIIRNLKKGTYKVKVLFKDCYDTASVVITEPDSLLLSAQVRNLSKQQGKDGKINLMPKGGTPKSDGKYTYAWLFPDGSKKTTEDLDSLTSGKYEVVVTDSMGCSAKLVVLIKEPDSLSVSRTVKDITCKGGKDGSIEGKLHGGVPPYKVFINTLKDTLTVTSAKPTFKFEGLDWNNAEPYEILVKDENNTAITFQVTLKEPAGEIALSYPQSVYCVTDASPKATLTGIRNGKFVASPAGLAINSSTGEIDLQKSAAGTYQISYQTTTAVCTVKPFAITIFGYPFKNGKREILTCESAVLDAKNAGLTYKWSTGETTQQITVRREGTYTVSIFNGTCSILDTVKVRLSQPTVQFKKADITCKGDASGTIEITKLSGGIGSYQIQWADDRTPNLRKRENLKAGVYTLVITDSIGCRSEQKITIAEPALALSATAEVKGTTGCFGENNGDIRLNVSGGTPPYSYKWEYKNATTSFITKLGNGIYPVVVTDSAKCSIKLFVLVTQADTMTVKVTVKEATCTNDGGIALEVTGGKAPYTFKWSNNATTATLSNLVPTVNVPYECIITDAQGCVKTVSTHVRRAAVPTATLSGTKSFCLGETAELTIRYRGTIYPYAFTYTDGKTPVTVSGIMDSVYKFVVKPTLTSTYKLSSVVYGSNCAAILQGEANITVFDLPEILTILSSNENCGNKDGKILVSDKDVKSGKAPFEYSIDGKTFSKTDTFGSLKAGTYTLTVRDANKCLYVYPKPIEIRNQECLINTKAIPTVITPNGDGQNDTWEVASLANFKDCTITIFSRWGGEVFSSITSSSKAWDGSNKGQELPLGTYYYVIDLKKVGHSPITGFIDLRR